MEKIREYKTVNLALKGEERFDIQAYITTDGNVLLPYYTMLKYLYGKKSLVATRKIKPLVENYFIENNGSKLVPAICIKDIFSIKDDYKRMISVISQVHMILSPKKEPYIDKVRSALKTINSLSPTLKAIGENIHNCDLKQCDILHEFESILSDECLLDKAKELQDIRNKRRDYKNHYKSLNYVKNNLDNLLGEDTTFFSRTLAKFLKLRKELEENPIYHYRSKEENEKILNVSIQKLKEKYN